MLRPNLKLLKRGATGSPSETASSLRPFQGCDANAAHHLAQRGIPEWLGWRAGAEVIFEHGELRVAQALEVTRVRPQPLQTTSNSRLDFSGKSSPFCTNALDVPVDLLAHVSEGPSIGRGGTRRFAWKTYPWAR